MLMHILVKLSFMRNPNQIAAIESAVKVEKILMMGIEAWNWDGKIN